MRVTALDIMEALGCGWFFTTHRSQADLRVFYTKNRSEADLVIRWVAKRSAACP